MRSVRRGQSVAVTTASGGEVDPRTLQACPICDGAVRVGWTQGGGGRWVDDRGGWNRITIPFRSQKMFQAAVRCDRCEVVIISRVARFNRWQ